MTLPQFQLKNKSGTNYQPIVERFINATTAGITMAWGMEHTATEDGWILVISSCITGQQDTRVHIDGSCLVAGLTNNTASYVVSIQTFPIKKNQKYKAVGGTSSCQIQFIKTT